MNNKLVSIILPVYNGEKYLKESIESVIAQTYQNWELIIVNDCSTDNTLEIAQNFVQNDNRIKIINNETNLKLPASLNAGFKEAKGDYYTWTSDDNLYKPKAIEYMVNILESQADTSLVSCSFDVISEKGDKVADSHEWYQGVRNVEQIFVLNNIGACFMYRSKAAKQAGEYDTRLFLAEDYDYWMRLASIGNVYYSDENLYQYRTHSKSLSITRQEEVLHMSQKVVLKNILPLLEKITANKKEQIIKLLDLYKKDNKTMWIDLANKIDAEFTNKMIRKAKMKKILRNIFSVTNEENKKVIRILGVKISMKKNKQKRIDYLKKYYLAKEWIEKYTVNNNGIAVESNQPNTIYPEVTGYYIPTLLKFGDRKRAVNFGDYLLTIQNNDGSWNDPSGRMAYTFDTGQILKGLVALIENGLDENDKYKNALIKGSDWILSMQREDGSIGTPDYSAWQLPFDKEVPEATHLYCLEPVRKAGQMYGISKYEDCIQKALKFYLSKEDLTDFTTLSHFNAYIIEALIDLGETERAKRAMDLISLYQRPDGSVSAYSFVDFVCSTGLLQYAICWYKLGEIEKADKAFNYVCKLQNKSGGWFGSYTVSRDKANYFEKGEIAWVVKYFLDAIFYREKAKYEDIAHIFLDNIDDNDERYTTIENELNSDKYNKVLDLGCGKGRYTKKLIKKFPNKEFHCVDLSSKVMKYLEANVNKKQGSILNIPYSDNYFDFIFLCESLEHCIDLNNAIAEISRVLKPGGKVVVVDKNAKALGKLELADFEQWFDEKKLCNIFRQNNMNAIVKSNLEYENGCRNDLFSAWIGGGGKIFSNCRIMIFVKSTKETAK